MDRLGYNALYIYSMYRYLVKTPLISDVYMAQGQGQKAIALYQEALTYDTMDVYSYRKLGELIPGEDGNYYRTRALQYQQQQ